MAESSFVLHVERVQPGCTVPRGLELAPAGATIVLGRTSESDVVLDDVSVSRRHVELRARATGFTVKSLTASGSTFVNSRELAAEEELAIDEQGAWLQLGRILLRIVLAPSTMRVPEAMPLPEVGPAPRTTLVTVAHGKGLRVWIGGQVAALFPSAARVLARLCETPGEVVTHDQLLDVVDPEHLERAGGANVTQLVTYVRDAFDAALAAGTIAEEDLRALVIAADPSLAVELAEADRRELLRALVASRRGLGYTLRLPRTAVALT